MRIFWPATAQPAGSERGAVYGWVNGNIVVVVGVVFEGRETVLRRLVSAQNVDKLVQQAGSLPTVIGTYSESKFNLSGQDYKFVRNVCNGYIDQPLFQHFGHCTLSPT